MVVLDFQKRKNNKQPISMITCYDYWTAQILNDTNVDCLLVGDSLAMVMHGYKTPIPADIDLMALHTKAVVRGAPDKFIIADLPFLSYRKSLKDTMNNVCKIMQAGAHAVKIEGAEGLQATIQHIVTSGVPVIGHLGLIPQSFHQLGGFRVQAKDKTGVETLIRQAKMLEEAGCFSIVLECIPATAASEVTKQIKIPTIGIGAGQQVDGQVLVLQDLLGMNTAFKPKFLKTYADGFGLIKSAVNRYDEEVKTGQFPTEQESF